jgi:Outer membrane protein beta-barrel domain
MNRITFFLLTLGCFASASATAQSRFSLAPTLGYGFQNNIVSVHVHDWPISTTVTNTRTHWATWAGLNVHYTFSSRWSASAGLVYNRVSGAVFVETENSLVDCAGPCVLGYVTRGTTQTLQLPVSINYTGSFRRLSPYLSVGSMLNYNYRFRYDPLTADVDRKLTDLDALTVRAMAGAGVIYRLNPKVALIVQPNVIYEFRKTSIYQRFYDQNTHIQVGLQTQVKFSF